MTFSMVEEMLWMAATASLAAAWIWVIWV